MLTMPRPPRCFEANTSYHVTLRCNNQAFDLRRPQARQAILLCLARAKAKFNFKLYGVCVMSNHVHYCLKPEQPHQMSRLMHWLNWYCAMLLNRLLLRRGHFWEQRYHAEPVKDNDVRHSMMVLRYIHANPLAAKMLEGFDYAYSNYASYARLKDDGLTVWHPAFLKLERSLDACASVYAAFCRRYQSKPKPNPRSRWGVWQLWQEVNKRTKSTKKSSTQTDLFAQNGARYHGGSQTQAVDQTVGILRHEVIAQVSQFLRVSQGV